MCKIRIFKSLKPKDLPDGFDPKIHVEEPIIKIEELEQRIVISYIFPGFYLSDDQRDVKGEKISFHQVKIAKTGFLAESGKPLLPSFGRYIQIPYNCDFKYNVEKGEPILYDNIKILPAQMRLTDNQNKHDFEYDEDFYDKDEFYPSDLVKITGPFEIDDYNALLVHVAPIQHNPAKKQLQGYGNISITIDLIPKKNNLNVYPFEDPDYDKEAYGNFFLNPKRRVEERLKIDLGKIEIFPKPRGPEFLIIYADTFEKAAMKLKKWKNIRGLITDMVHIRDIGNDSIKIKKYIRERRRQLLSRLRYVLLFGDADMITPETIPGGPYGSNITDYYYSTKNDPTVNDPGDYVYSWLSIGRIPVRTADEGMGVVKQIIAYEKNPPKDPEYYRRMAFAAYFQDNNKDGQADRAYIQTMEEIRDHMIILEFDVERIYVSNYDNPTTYYDGTPIPDEVIDSIIDENTATDLLISMTNEGQLFIGHRDHGDFNGWSHPSYDLNDLTDITSTTPTIFYSINCLTGMFDASIPLGESFAEKMLRITGGAPSLIAATRLSNTWLNNDLMKAMFDAMWAGVLSTFPGSTASYPIRFCRLGDILNYGKAYLPITMSASEMYIKDHFEIYHVIGDPTLELWKNEPCRIRIYAKIIMNYLHIFLSFCPKGSIITVWVGDKMLKRIKPTSTNVKISLRGIPGSRLYPTSTYQWIQMRKQIAVYFWPPGCGFYHVMVRISN